MFTRSLPRWVVPAVLWVLRVVTAGMLAVDAYTHVDQAFRYEPNRDNGISQGDLFRIEAGAASFAALAVLVLVGRTAWALVGWALAIIVAASALGAVMIYTHYDIGTLGPLPNMYEPFWFAEKTRAAVAEGIATGTGTLGFLITAWSAWASRRTKRATLPEPLARRRDPPLRARIRHDT
jgi:hypothetical protein